MKLDIAPVYAGAMRVQICLVGVLAAGVGCGGSGKGSVSCPGDADVVAVEAGTLEDPSFVDIYETDQVCLSRNPQAIATAIGVVVTTDFTAPSVIGLYQYDNFGTFGEPIVDLEDSVGASGASLWQDHGCEANPATWGIETDSDGKAHVYEEGVAGKKFRIWSMQHEDCIYKCEDGGFCDPAMVGMHVDVGRKNKWVLADYTVFTGVQTRGDGTDLGQIAIFGERWK